MKWNKISSKDKPKTNSLVLIFMEGFDNDGEYWSAIRTAYYAKNPNDKRRKCFYEPNAFEVREGYSCWPYLNVTHWMELPKTPEPVNPDEYETQYYFNVRK